MAEEIEHLKPGDKCKIHTAKSGTCPGEGSCNYKTNCGSLEYKPEEAHHVLSVSCVNGYVDYNDKVRDYIERCYRETEWCINQKPNLIALPKWPTYCWEAGSRSLDLPCHDWDHYRCMKYCWEVKQDLKTVIWDELNEAEEPHNAKGKSLQKHFVKLEKKWKKEIRRRGRRNKGTEHSWKHKATDTHWWWPFSMGSDAYVKTKSWAYGPIA